MVAAPDGKKSRRLSHVHVFNPHSLDTSRISRSPRDWIGRLLRWRCDVSAAICSGEIWCFSAATIHSTLSEQGGVVSEPR